MLQSKHKGWLNGFFKHTHTHTHTLLIRDPLQTKINTHAESKGMERVFYTNGNKVGAGDVSSMEA